MKNNVKKVDTKQLSMDFLLDCAFGRHDDLIMAAIDKAYVDMASHTLIIKKEDYQTKWRYRYNTTECIKNAICGYPWTASIFEEWHKNLIEKMIKQYDDILCEGQAQKWINMTVKYIFVLKEILGKNDKRMKDACSFISNTNEKDYFPPVDSYILKAANITGIGSWSKMNNNVYEKLKESLSEDRDFLWELESWREFAQIYKENSKESYAAYVNAIENG